ncbi:MAG: hypothetical protein M0Z59_04935 [Nitrospiraceae bacterium]|nr:hypothetical protein [Nitrospiraceae bacterium]
MKTAALVIAFALVSACTYAPPKPVYYQSRYIEPMPAGLMVGPPIVEKNPAQEVKKKMRALPPVILIFGRSLYFYSGLYYYYWDKDWFYSMNRTGPWYILPKEKFPTETAVIEPGKERPLDIEKPFRTTPPQP